MEGGEGTAARLPPAVVSAAGELVRADFRGAAAVPPPRRSYVRVVTWNVERGYRLDALVAELAAADADILLLQEVDVGAARSGRADVGAALARALRMQFMFVSEGALSCGGCEGLAILSRFDLSSPELIPLACVRNSYKPKRNFAKRHFALAATAATPQLGPLPLACLHLEAYAGRVARRRQYAPVRAWAKRQLAAGRSCVVGGDLNTHGHGLARLLGRATGGDPYRWSAWGLSEASWWVGEGAFGALADPFDPEEDATFSVQLPARGCGVTVWRGKLDHLLLSPGPRVVRKRVSVGSASDHQYLCVDLEGGASSS
jgi:endonuclease/exonuclease/phosphatase family metal-dependent hydrolase